MRIFIIILFLGTLHFQCSVQKKAVSLKCGGLGILDVKPYVKGVASCSPCDISIKSLKDGFSIVLADSSYKIIGFQIVYTNNEKEVIVKDVSGSMVSSKEFDFLSKIEVGNFISIECINIHKGNEWALSTSLWIYVTN